jgi:tellurite resistance protein TerB
MAIWDRLRTTTTSMQHQLNAKKNDLKSGAFRDASMAICALVAAADGTIDPEERRKVAALIASNEILQNFPAEQLQQKFDGYCAHLQTDFDLAKISVIQDIGKTKKKPTEARAVIQIGIIIGGADGHFDKAEQQVVREACYAVGLDPNEFDL